MGRPFAQELNAIEETINAASTVQIENLIGYIKNALDKPIIVVGSGGSFSVASIVTLIIQELGGFAKAITPYDLKMEKNNLNAATVIIITAGGGNIDIINAYKYINRYTRSFVVCAKKDSKLIQLMINKNDTDFLEFDIPHGKDGFLAVNSSIAFITIFWHLLCVTTKKEFVINGKNFCVDTLIDFNVLNKNTIIALCGGWTNPVAIDFESKCTEAGLVNVQYANYRNFAHGRHHWIAKNELDTSVICFADPEEIELAKRTMRLIPDNIPKTIVETNLYGIEGILDLMIKMYKIVNKIGEIKYIDPGKPGVPLYGKNLYHLGYNIEKTDYSLSLVKNELKSRAIKRKKESEWLFDLGARNNYYNEGYDRYILDLKNCRFNSIIFDYDGTIAYRNETEIRNQILDKIIILLGKGIHIGIATGRGKSVRQELQSYIPFAFWDLIWIAYYNGAYISILSDNSCPCIDESINQEICKLQKIIKVNNIFNSSDISVRTNQLTIITEQYNLKILKKIIDEILRTFELSLTAFLSDHSIDIVPNSITKKNLLNFFIKKYEGKVLCIGDSGNFEGNDFDLLCADYSLSVDKVSSMAKTCWNLAPLGISGLKATIYYLNNLVFSKNNNTVYFSSKFFK